MEKTHWLQTPNKKYLGHQDLPSGKDIVVTIISAKWEEVKDPTKGTTDNKRVVRFEEKDIKPFICNQTNAGSIIQATGSKFMEDTVGKKIQFYVAQTKVKKVYVDCLRIREEEPKGKEELVPTHSKWEGAVGALKKDKDINLEKWYTISDENKTLLLKQANNE
jgi:hypothetical protein